jgi:hypothetical protein
MNVREALRAIDDERAFPETALRWLLDNWAESRNVLLQTLARTARTLPKMRCGRQAICSS